MMTFRNCLSLAALIGAVGLVEPVAAQAKTHAQSSKGSQASFVLQKERLCNMLLHKLDGSIAHQNTYINRQDQLIARELTIQQEIAQSPQQSRQLQRAFTQLGIKINQIQAQLNIGKIRVTSQEGNVNNCLNMLAQVNATNPKLANQLANYLQLAFARAAIQAAEVEAIVNRPAATPFVPF